MLAEGESRLPQPIEPGDASAAVSTNSLRVLGAADTASEVIQRVRLSSGIITPNGDGVNDRLAIEYALFLLPAPVPVVLNVYDLAGNRRAQMEVGAQGTGPQRAFWDGRDEQGALLPPGLYLLDLALVTEAKHGRSLGPWPIKGATHGDLFLVRRSRSVGRPSRRRCDSAEKWQTFRAGTAWPVRALRAGRSANPVRDAGGPRYDGASRAGRIFRAGSNMDAFKIDGDANTFWQPDPADPLAKWEVEIDLGRRCWRKSCACTSPTKHLAQFTVYVATGATAQGPLPLRGGVSETLPNGDRDPHRAERAQRHHGGS